VERFIVLHFQYWKSSKNGKWYWHLRATNNEVIAEGQGYDYERDCLHCIELVKGTGQYTPVYKL
jgi:uncharacterized protein YegP (UPF0339 family)